MEHVSEQINNSTGNKFACAGKYRGVCVVFIVCIDETRQLLCLIWEAESSRGRICQPHTFMGLPHFRKWPLYYRERKMTIIITSQKMSQFYNCKISKMKQPWWQMANKCKLQRILASKWGVSVGASVHKVSLMSTLIWLLVWVIRAWWRRDSKESSCNFECNLCVLVQPSKVWITRFGALPTTCPRTIIF